MRKKILVICIMGMFLLTSLTTLSVSGIKISTSEKVCNSEKQNDPLTTYELGKVRIGIGSGSWAYVDNYVKPDIKYNSGEYKAYAEVQFIMPGYEYQYRGMWQASIYVDGTKFINEYNSFEYANFTEPDDLSFEGTNTIPKGKHFVTIFAYVKNYVLHWKNYGGSPPLWTWGIDHLEEKENEFNQWVTFPVDTQVTFSLHFNKSFNTPFINALENHPNLLPILRLLSQRLGLQY